MASVAATFDAPFCGSNARFILTVANALVDQATDQKERLVNRRTAPLR